MHKFVKRLGFPLLATLSCLVCLFVFKVNIAVTQQVANFPDQEKQSIALKADSSNRFMNSAGVDKFVTENLRRTGLPGVALAITKDNKIVYTAGYGHDSKNNTVTADTQMYIASLSKSFTAIAVMQLVEQGKLRLDVPVHHYLSEFGPIDSRSAQITIRQILNQTSGMADAGFPEMSLPQPDSLKASVARMQVAKLVADPGTQWNYHNPNYQIAARLVEVVSGEPFADYLKQHVFEPLGMKSSFTVNTVGQSAPSVADGYSFIYGKAVAHPMLSHFVNGSGGVVSTAHDLAQWLVLHNNEGKTADGRQIISATSIEEMHNPSSPSSGDYAFGWEEDILEDGSRRIEHGGTIFAFSAHQAIFPKSKYGFALLFNSAGVLGGEQISFIEGLNAVIKGTTPDLGIPISLIVDSVIAILTLITFILGIRSVIRVRVWVERRFDRPVWRNGLAMLPRLIPVAIFVFCPAIVGWIFGSRDVPWTSLIYAWPSLVIWLAVAALFSSYLLVAPVLGLIRLSRSQHTQNASL